MGPGLPSKPTQEASLGWGPRNGSSGLVPQPSLSLKAPHMFRQTRHETCTSTTQTQDNKRTIHMRANTSSWEGSYSSLHLRWPMQQPPATYGSRALERWPGSN